MTLNKGGYTEQIHKILVIYARNKLQIKINGLVGVIEFSKFPIDQRIQKRCHEFTLMQSLNICIVGVSRASML